MATLTCPAEIKQWDSLADVLWPLLVRKAGSEMLAQFGIPDLAFRLQCQTIREERAGTGRDAEKRARIWRLICEKSRPGKSEVPMATEADLIPWMGTQSEPQTAHRTTGAKCFRCNKSIRISTDTEVALCRSCRSSDKKRVAQEAKLKKTGKLSKSWKVCQHCNRPFQPKRSTGQFCSDRCRWENRPSRHAKPQNGHAETRVNIGDY